MTEQITYLGETAKLSVNPIGSGFSTFVPEPEEPEIYQVTLNATHIQCKSKPCSSSQVNTIKNMYKKFFQQTVRKHLSPST